MPLSVYLALITLAPAGCAVLIALLGLAGRVEAVRAAEGVGNPAFRPLALALAVLGALLPAVGLLLFTPSSQVNGALFVTLFGGSISEHAWLSAAYRMDGFGLYAALGIALFVTPLLLWMAWQHGVPPAGQEPEPEADEDQDAEAAYDVRPVLPSLPGALWGGLALALAVESAALTLVFSDNVLWMALAWILLAALAWGLGEIGNPPETLDWPGLALMLAGPVLWTVIFFIPAFGGKGGITVYPRLTDMMGRGTITPLHVLGLALALALAAGAYPFLAWVRGRAALITPAGLAVLALGVMPAALFVGGRLYSAAQDGTGAWQQIGGASPPITGGVFFTLIGAVTVGIAGLMALERRDSRALIAYLTVAQAGWGFVALGTGAPAGITGLVVLLATSTVGLGAMLAAIYAAGTLTSDIEPDAAGPRPFGAPIAPVRLAAWCVGALAVVGAPLCAGFVGRQLITVGAIEARGLIIPLTALAWAGDALLGLALLRATAPAFTAALGFGMPAAVNAADAHAGSEPAVDETDLAQTHPPVPPWGAVTAERVLALLSEAPAAVLALLAVIVAVAPQQLLVIGAIPAVGALLPPALVNTVAARQLGYSVGGMEVLPTLAWGAFVIFLALRMFLVPGGARQMRPVTLAGAMPLEPAPVEERVEPAAAEPEMEVGAEGVHELAGLPEPVDAWADLGLAFRSAWTLPGAEWLVRGVEEEPDATEVGAESGTAAEDLGEAEQVDADQDGGAGSKLANGVTSARDDETGAHSPAGDVASDEGTVKSAKSRKPGRTGNRP